MLVAKGHTSTSREVVSESSGLNHQAFLAQEFPMLYSYLGDSAFSTIARSHGIANAASSTDFRWLCNHLPAFLGRDHNWPSHPEIVEIASLELAMNTAASAPDLPPLKWEQIEHLRQEQTSALPWTLHPSVQLLRFQRNTTSIWSALRSGERAPAPYLLDKPQAVLVWRQGESARFRMLGDEEALALDHVKRGQSPSATWAMRGEAEHYLREWVESELLLQIKSKEEF